MRDAGAGDVEEALDVGGEHPVPVGIGDGDGSLEDAVNTGTVDDVVDVGVLGDYGCDEGVTFLGRGYVKREGEVSFFAGAKI